MNRLKTYPLWLPLLAALISAPCWADESAGMPAVAAEPVQPLSKAEIQLGMAELQQRQNQRIEEWGKTLKPDDFEWGWFGRQLKKPKRQEVCGLYQGLIDETYSLAQQNKSRLPAADQQQLEDRSLFIQSLGYKDNIVDTRMGFNCRIR